MGFEINEKMLRNRRNHSRLNIADFAVGAKGPFYEENDAQAKMKDCVFPPETVEKPSLKLRLFFH